MKHYAKGMCNHCYHLFGRKNAGLATNCEHKDRNNYCKGLCMNCYINSYNRCKKNQTTWYLINIKSINETKYLKLTAYLIFNNSNKVV